LKKFPSLTRVVLVSVLAFGAAAAIGVSTAAANDDGFYPPYAPTPTHGSTPSSGQTAGVNRSSKGSLFSGKHCTKAHGKKVCFYYKGGHLTKRCSTKGKTTTCILYKRNAPHKVCVHKRGHRTRCHKAKVPKTAQRAKTARQKLGLQPTFSPGAGVVGRRATLPKNFRSLAGLNAEGFGNDIPAVGQIYVNGQPHCSGTLVGYGIVLTAGHCVWDLNAGNYYPLNSLTFAPDETVMLDYGNLPYAQYGEYSVVNAVTTAAFAAGDAGGDWGFLLLSPDANGVYPGQYTGTWSIYENINPLGRAWLAGYPGEGVFHTSDYYSGYAQYHSDTTWDGSYLPVGWKNVTSKPIILYQSKMTGGSSGGAVINQLSDGTWAVGGVINMGFTHQCLDNSCRAGQPNYTGDNYWSDWQGSVYFDSDIGGFYAAMLSSFGLS
jgi:hypothetical protein